MEKNILIEFCMYPQNPLNHNPVNSFPGARESYPQAMGKLVPGAGER